MRILTGLLTCCVLLLAASPAAAQLGASNDTPDRPFGASGDVPYVPTPPEVVDAMLKLAKVTGNDVVYDLGCGDGRIVITAASRLGARGVGFDINPERISEARENAKLAGVEDRVHFTEQNLFDADISEASVVTLYLLSSVNLRLRPKLWQELKPGTRVVSHMFDMGDWEPDEEINVNGRRIYLWTIKEGQAAAAASE
jgi:SAM-dependent methyltransferase